MSGRLGLGAVTPELLNSPLASTRQACRETNNALAQSSTCIGYNPKLILRNCWCREIQRDYWTDITHLWVNYGGARLHYFLDILVSSDISLTNISLQRCGYFFIIFESICDTHPRHTHSPDLYRKSCAARPSMQFISKKKNHKYKKISFSIKIPINEGKGSNSNCTYSSFFLSSPKLASCCCCFAPW